MLQAKRFHVTAQAMFTSERAQTIIEAQDENAALRIANIDLLEANYYPVSVEEIAEPKRR
jgi:hypothetical protein